MKTLFTLFAFIPLFAFTQTNCSFNGFPLHGKWLIVNSHQTCDLRVLLVESYQTYDVKIEPVQSFQSYSECGKVLFVKDFQTYDVRVRFVNSNETYDVRAYIKK